MQRKSLVVVLLLLYTAVVSWIGYLGADPGVAEAFTGSAGAVLIGALALVYGTVAGLTFWFVGFLTRLTYKMAAGRLAESRAAGLDLVVVIALFSRLPGLLTTHFLHSGVGVATLAVPLIVGAVLLARDKRVAGPRKLLVLLPLAGYLVIDAVFLLTAVPAVS